MKRSLLLLSGLTLALTVTASSGVAFADEPKPAGSFQREDTPKEYTAPLSQTKQPSYVPQSVALSGPKQIDYQEGEPVPPGYTPVQRARKGPIVGGAVLFGTLYMLSALAASIDADSSTNKDLAPLWIPGVGPFITMFNTESATGKFFLAVDGLGQSAGLALLIYGLTSPKTVLLRNDLTGQTKPSVRAVPLMTGGGTGVGLVGTF